MLENAPDWHNPFSRDKVIPALVSIALVALLSYSPQECNSSEQKSDTTYINKTPKANVNDSISTTKWSD